MTEAKPWEIWWAYVAFEDQPDGKRRPVQSQSSFSAVFKEKLLYEYV